MPHILSQLNSAEDKAIMTIPSVTETTGKCNASIDKPGLISIVVVIFLLAVGSRGFLFL